MTCFTPLESAALRSIFDETPELSAALERQLQSAEVISRENTSGGFFTSLRVTDASLAINCGDILGYHTFAQVDGLDYGLGMILHMKSGLANMLEGYATAPESTAALDLERLNFKISAVPPT